jgi:hypothetical protein
MNTRIGGPLVRLHLYPDRRGVIVLDIRNAEGDRLAELHIDHDAEAPRRREKARERPAHTLVYVFHIDLITGGHPDDVQEERLEQLSQRSLNRLGDRDIFAFTGPMPSHG